MQNSDVAHALEEIGNLLEIAGENPFKIRSYRHAAHVIEKSGTPVAELVAEQRLRALDGIGDALESKITELVQTGELPYLTRLREKFPDTILELLRVEGLGPKGVKKLYDLLGVASLDALRKACEAGQVAALPGFNKKSEAKLLAGVAFVEAQQGQFRLNVAWSAAASLRQYLLDHAPVSAVEVAGSLRRYKEVVKDIDMIAASEQPDAVMECFRGAPGVQRVTGSGPTKTSVVMEQRIAVDLRVVEPSVFASAWLHFTGSKEHNIVLRRRAAERGMKLSEYGLEREGGGREICVSEQELYALLDLPFIPPELREDVSEFSFQETPRLVEAGDLRGVIHCHSDWTDGVNSIGEMAQAARDLDYAYLVLTDHSVSSVLVNGLTEERVRAQFEAIDAVNAQFAGFRVVKGIEADILNDGRLDYADTLLSDFEFVIASIHNFLEMTEAEATMRLVRAIEDPRTSVIGHLTGRLLLSRKGYEVDVDRVVDAAIANGVAFEINANPRRLDMDWRHLRRAADKGAYFAIGPDAHRIAGLHNMRYGLGIARKGALPPERILNCLSVEEIIRWRG